MLPLCTRTVAVTVVLAIAAGLYLYARSPESLLLYTPAPGVPVHRSSSFLVGFALVNAAFVPLALLVSAGAAVWRRKPFALAALGVAGWCAAVSLFVALAERWSS